MAGIRFQITLDGFIPEDPNGVQIAGVKIPIVFAEKIPAFRTKVHDIKDFMANMKRVLSGEKLQFKATYHKCFHDEIPPKQCESEQEI